MSSPGSDAAFSSSEANLNVQGHRAASIRSGGGEETPATVGKPAAPAGPKTFDKEKSFVSHTRSQGASRPQFQRYRTTLAVSTNYLNAVNPLQYGASIIELKPFSNRHRTAKASTAATGQPPPPHVLDGKQPQPTISTLVNVLSEKSLFGQANKLQSAQSFDASPVQHNEACAAASVELSRQINDMNLLSQLDTLRTRLNANQQRSPRQNDSQQQQESEQMTSKKRSKSSFIVNKKQQDGGKVRQEPEDPEGERNLLLYQQARTPMLNEYRHIVSVRGDQHTPPAPPPSHMTKKLTKSSASNHYGGLQHEMFSPSPSLSLSPVVTGSTLFKTNYRVSTLAHHNQQQQKPPPPTTIEAPGQHANRAQAASSNQNVVHHFHHAAVLDHRLLVPDNSETSLPVTRNENLSDSNSIVSIVALDKDMSAKERKMVRAKTHNYIYLNKNNRELVVRQQTPHSRLTRFDSAATKTPHSRLAVGHQPSAATNTPLLTLSRQPTSSSIVLNNNFQAVIDFERNHATDEDEEPTGAVQQQTQQQQLQRHKSSATSGGAASLFDRGHQANSHLLQRNVNRAIRKSSRNRMDRIYNSLDLPETSRNAYLSQSAQQQQQQQQPQRHSMYQESSSSGKLPMQPPGTEESSHEPNGFGHPRPQSIPDHDQLEIEHAIYDCEECRREYESLTNRAEAHRRQIYNLGLIARKEHPFVRFRRIKETPVQIIQNIISDIPSTLSTMSQFGRVTNVEKILANKLADFYTNNARI